MNDQHEHPLATYLDALGGPDPEASDRLARSMERAIGRSERPAVPRWAWAAAAILIAGPTAFFLLRSGPPAASDGVATVETGRAVQELRLGHEGRATLAGQTRVQVLHNDDRGARIRLLGGSVTMDVNHVDGATWAVESEGYVVMAVGTVFTVEHRRQDAPGVVVREGVVRLTGPGLPSAGVEIGAPEVGAEVARLAPGPEEPASAGPSEPASGTEEAPAAADARPEPTLARPGAPAWVQRFRRAIEEGKLADAAAVLPARFPRGSTGGLGASDVLDAGDALRAAGETERAVDAYRSVCERWSRSGSCGVATLREALLEARRGNKTAAIEGATRYLDREPRGALARDALGRRMQWRSEVGNRSGARSDAAEYLERWPNGSLAATARGILND